MKRAAKKARMTVRTGVSVDNASSGGPYAARFARATSGRVSHWKTGKEPVPANGVEVHLEEWAPERGSRDVYLSVEIQRRGESHSFDVPGFSEAHLDALVELLTVARDRARETFFVDKKRKAE